MPKSESLTHRCSKIKAFIKWQQGLKWFSMVPITDKTLWARSTDLKSFIRLSRPGVGRCEVSVGLFIPSFLSMLDARYLKWPAKFGHKAKRYPYSMKGAAMSGNRWQYRSEFKGIGSFASADGRETLIGDLPESQTSCECAQSLSKGVFSSCGLEIWDWFRARGWATTDCGFRAIGRPINDKVSDCKKASQSLHPDKNGRLWCNWSRSIPSLGIRNRAMNLEIERPEQVWVGDIMYIRLQLEFVYLAVLMDMFTRSIHGWQLGRSMDQSLTVAALTRGLEKGTPEIHHSDRGM